MVEQGINTYYHDRASSVAYSRYHYLVTSVKTHWQKSRGSVRSLSNNYIQSVEEINMIGKSKVNVIPFH